MKASKSKLGVATDLVREQKDLVWDTKAKMRGKVVNKRARHNLCFDEEKQEPDYENGKGTIVGFDEVPLTQHIRDSLPGYFGEKANALKAEGNLYYDISVCGIGVSW